MGGKSSSTRNSQRILTGLLFDVLKSVFIGSILFLFAASILWMNEWHHLVELTRLQSEETAIISANNQQVNSENEGRFVYITGTIKASSVKDEWLEQDVSALRFYRRVQRFQRQAQGEGTIGVWADQQQADLPALFAGRQASVVSSQLLQSDSPQLGPYSLSKTLIEKITQFQRYPLEESLNNPEQLKSEWTLHEDCLYWQKSEALPQEGDYRVSFYYIPAEQEVSLLARQAEHQLEPFITSEGTVLEFLELGSKNAAELYPDGQNGTPWMVWLFRVSGWAMMWAGCWCLIALGRRVLNQLNLENRKVALSPGKLSCVASTLITSLVIAAAWIYYQPLWATIMTVLLFCILVGGGYYYLRRYRLTNNAQADLQLLKEPIK